MKKNETINNKNKWNKELLPILFLVVILPFVTRLAVIQTNLDTLAYIPTEMGVRGDFFLFFKSRVFVFISIIMLFLLLDYFFIRGRLEKGIRQWTFLILYEVLVVLSTVFSAYRQYSLYGMMEHFETIWVLLGYGVVAYYTYVFVKDKKDFRLVIGCMLGAAFVQGVIGLFQLAGCDLLSMEWMKQLIVPAKHADLRNQIIFNFASEEYQKVYTTLYNPNYAGVYFAMLLPIGLLFFQCVSKKKKVLLVIVLTICILCFIGTGSKSAVIALLLTVLIAGIFISIHNKKNLKYVLLLTIGFVLSFVIYDVFTANQTINRIVSAFEKTNEEYALYDIAVQKDCINIQFGERNISFYYEKKGNALSTVVLDEKGQPLELISNEKTQKTRIKDKDFKGLRFQCYIKNEIPYISMEYQNIKWLFTNMTADGSYTYINLWGKPAEIKKAESMLFDGKESLFTNRGYIWGRTLPLLKDFIFLGSGPDTFLLVFPQDDYVKRSSLGYGFLSEILTKPHNMYLQIAIQTGVLSLLCFLAFIGNYLMKAGRFFVIYKKKESSNGKGVNKKEELPDFQIGFALFLSILCYLVMGVTNDSMIVTAPMFFVMLGMGMKFLKLYDDESMDK